MNKIFTVLVAIILSIGLSCAQNDYTAKYIDLGRQSAALYQPTTASAKTGIAVVVMHSHQDYMNFIANGELAKRGYTVLATKPNDSNLLEDKLVSLKYCIDYLRKQDNIHTIILLGHSGGATVISAYEYLAENGRDGLQDMIYQDYSDKIDNLPKADAVMLLDANPGLSTITINSLDPNVSDESTGYSLGNKYNYDEEREYMRGQQERYTKLVEFAKNRLQLIKDGKGLYADDEPLIIPGAQSMRFYNKLYSSNTNLLSHTNKAWPLIHADGSITTEIVHSVRAPFNPVDRTEMLATAQQLTVRSFLSSFAIDVDKDYEVTETGFKGIHFDSNLTSPIGNARGIHIPTLVMGMTGSYEYINSEAIYENLPAEDKTIAFIEGAGHMFTTDRQAERYNKANYGDTLKNLFDYVDNWLSTRFANRS